MTMRAGGDRTASTLQKNWREKSGSKSRQIWEGNGREIAGEKGGKRGLRSRRLHFPWQSESAGRRRARRRIKVLRWHHPIKADNRIAAEQAQRREVIRLRKSFLSIVRKADVVSASVHSSLQVITMEKWVSVLQGQRSGGSDPQGFGGGPEIDGKGFAGTRTLFPMRRSVSSCQRRRERA